MVSFNSRVLFFDLRYTVDEPIFFPEISSIFLYIVYSVLLLYRLMFLQIIDPLLLGLITFIFYFSLLIYTVLFSISSKIFWIIHFCFIFLSTLCICSTAASMSATLNFTHWWSTSLAFPETSNSFWKPHVIFFLQRVWLNLNKA